MPIAIKDSKIDISSEETTKELAKDLRHYLKGGEIIFLYGEMGVGKTTFVRHLIHQFQKTPHNFRLYRDMVKYRPLFHMKVKQ